MCVRVCLCGSVCAMCPLGLTHDDFLATFLRLKYLIPCTVSPIWERGGDVRREWREYFREGRERQSLDGGQIEILRETRDEGGKK